MANNTVKVHHIMRNDTATNWEAKNPVLLAGEFGICTDTNLIKIGDGVKTWSELEYVNDPASAKASHYEVVANADETDDVAIARALGENTASSDDICVVKRVINGSKMSYTAFVFDGSVWKAFSGNYNAANVYFDSDIIATEKVGTITIGSTGSTTVSAAGKSVKDVLSSILAKESNPAITQPSASINSSTAKAYEVGTKVTPAYSASFNKGSYSYGPDTGLSAKSWSVANSETDEVLTTATGTFAELTVGDSTNYKITATASYDDGAVPKTNLGNDYAAGQIKAGTKAATSGAITGYRSFFYGVVKTDALTSDVIRGLTNGGAYNGAKTLTLDVSGSDNVGIVVAFPASSTRGGLTEVLLLTSMNANITADYVVQANVSVEGVGGYTAVPYKVYLYKPASLTAGQKHQIKLA